MWGYWLGMFSREKNFQREYMAKAYMFFGGQFLLFLLHVAGMMKQTEDVYLEKARFLSFYFYIFSKQQMA